MQENFTKVFDILSETKGDILDIGYGWGVSSQHFYSKGVKSLTIIEKRKDVYQKAQKWAEDKPNVHLHFGDWIDIIPSLDKKFDGNWRDEYHGTTENRQNDANYNPGTIDRLKALDILGLTDPVTNEQIKEAHRRLMLANHPDRGGSTFLATQINEAKDFLLENNE
mgnify:CR=1 FL=1